MMKGRHAALVFDLDGTLVDTAPDLTAALNAVLAARKMATVSLDTVRHMVGFGARALIRQAFEAEGQALTDETIRPLINEFIVHYRAHIADASVPFPGVPETLGQLRTGGARLGILTNKPQELVLPLLDALDLSRFFDAIHGAGRYAYVKPDARVFHHVLEELKADAGVMIGDSRTDVATARAAGAPVIVVSYGYTPEPAERLGADATAERFSDIPHILERLASQRSASS